MPYDNPIGIQCSRRRGYRMPPDTLRVCRPSRWGNPFTEMKLRGLHANYDCSNLAFGLLVADRWPSETILGMPQDYLPAVIVAIHLAWLNHWSAKWPEDFERWIAPLRGMNLACYCEIGSPCHRDNLLRFAANWKLEAAHG